MVETPRDGEQQLQGIYKMCFKCNNNDSSNTMTDDAQLLRGVSAGISDDIC